MATTIPTLAERAAAAQAEANRLRAEAERIDAAADRGRRAAELRIYSEAYEHRCPEYREARDAAFAKIGQLAAADQLSIDTVFDAWLELRELDAKAGAMNSFASMLEAVRPLPDNAIGAKQGRPPGVAELYKHLGFAQFIDAIVQKRTDRIRAQHTQVLRDGAYTRITQAAEVARKAAADSPQEGSK